MHIHHHFRFAWNQFWSLNSFHSNISLIFTQKVFACNFPKLQNLELQTKRTGAKEFVCPKNSYITLQRWRWCVLKLSRTISHHIHLMHIWLTKLFAFFYFWPRTYCYIYIGGEGLWSCAHMASGNNVNKHYTGSYS